MIQERAASGKADALSRPTGGCQTGTVPEQGIGARIERSAIWEDLYWAVSAEQQRELLALAEQQGVLYAHQLPATSNGALVHPYSDLLARIQDGAARELPPLHPEPVAVADSGLDAVQREAVAKALATPDILLVQGPPGSGKSRVVAEMIAAAAARGERVALLAPTAAAIDRVLDLLAPREAVLALRCVDRDEDVAALPTHIRALTFAERVRAITAHALDCGRRQAQADELRAQRLGQDESLWSQLQELAVRSETFEKEGQLLENARSQLEFQVVAEVDCAQPKAALGFVQLLSDLTRLHKQPREQAETRLADLRGRMTAGEQERETLDAEIQALQPLVDAKKQGRWWTANWWRATLRGRSTMTRWAEQQELCQRMVANLGALQEQYAVLRCQWDEAERVFASKKADHIAAEVARRRADLDDRHAALRHEQSVVQQKWQAVCASLAPESPRPAALTAAAVETARVAWTRLMERTEAQRTLARQWLAYLEQAPAALAARLPGSVNLVAATLTALPRDEHFGDGVAAPVNFDLLILDEADQITEPQFLSAARRGRRLVLVGEPAWPDQIFAASPRQNIRAKDSRHASAGLRSHATGYGCTNLFQRLWQQLHCDPGQLPYVWTQEQNRLCCRLRPVNADERSWLTTEHVADCPDIELRILSVPRCQPALAEIVFPPSFSLERAKQYIFQELEELAVQTSGSSLRWVEQEDRIVLRLADRDLAHGRTVDLMTGIREILGAVSSGDNGSDAIAAGWETCCLEFDRAAGWDRRRAAAWLREHLRLHDSGRTVRLTMCYRLQLSLAAMVSDSLPLGIAEGGAPSLVSQEAERNGCSAAIEFVPVPPLHHGADPPRGSPGARQRKMATVHRNSLSPALPRKGGAGLEIDLAEPRHRERLPTEWRAHLPNQGFVNYTEAQAVVRRLADFIQGAGQRYLAHKYRRDFGQPGIAVLALYPAQAELIRHLLRQDPALSELGEAIEVGVPAAFRQREADIVLVSLTRSHTHRAVAFGEGPQPLAVALTRACSKLILFGDPGTLVRRSQWEGPLEHLDEEAAARERQLITRLVHSLSGPWLTPKAHASPPR